MLPPKCGGITPMTVKGWLFTEIERPTAAGSPANLRCQYPYERTITGCAPGALSSAAWKPRPRNARTPSTSKKLALTSSPHARSACPSVRTLNCTPVPIAGPSISFASLRTSCQSGIEKLHFTFSGPRVFTITRRSGSVTAGSGRRTIPSSQV